MGRPGVIHEHDDLLIELRARRKAEAILRKREPLASAVPDDEPPDDGPAPGVV